MTKLVELLKQLSREDFREMMAALSLITGFIYIFCITFIPLHEVSQRYADIILGMVGTVIFGRIFGYYFDKDSKKKEEN